MELTTYVENLGREFAALAEAGGPDARTLVERLAGPLESAIRMTLLDALSDAADEITTDLAPGSVELRLRGRNPGFVVTAPPAETTDAAATTEDDAVAPTTDTATSTDEGPTTRINVRLPEQLKAAIEEAAAQQGRSVNAWLVRAATAGLQQGSPAPEAEPHPRTRSRQQRFTGWVR